MTRASHKKPHTKHIEIHLMIIDWKYNFNWFLTYSVFVKSMKKEHAKTAFPTWISNWFFLSLSSIAALTVRFLTKRYIGEYDHQADKVHKHEILVDTEAVLVEIWDTCMVSNNQNKNLFLKGNLRALCDMINCGQWKSHLLNVFPVNANWLNERSISVRGRRNN